MIPSIRRETLLSLINGLGTCRLCLGGGGGIDTEDSAVF